MPKTQKRLRGVAEGELLWTPSPAFVERSQLTHFTRWLERERALHFIDYEALWRWSVAQPDAFWSALWEYFAIDSSSPYSAVRTGTMPRVRWFADSRLNFAEHLLRYEKLAAEGEVAVVHSSETRALRTLTWHELGDAVRALATRLRRMGVEPGDRVVAYMPNVPETAIAMIATTAIGAVWSSAAPEFGAAMVLDRFAQIEPKILFAADGYRFAGSDYDRTPDLRKIVAGLPTLEAIVWLPYLDQQAPPPPDIPAVAWDDALAPAGSARDGFTYERVDSAHPLWILFSSGTTGVPKPIVHGHAGITLELLKTTALYCNLTPASRLFFYTSTGWMMWNVVVAGLLRGASIVLYDGHPAYPEPAGLWQLAADAGVTVFGCGPAYVRQTQQNAFVPKDAFTYPSLEMIFLAGSPTTPDTFAWLYDNVKTDVWVASQAGGTDVCCGLVGSVASRPVYAGEIQGRLLGIDVHAWNAAGEDVLGEVGELVITSACPSMPLFFWNDAGDERYRESYFDTYPGVWRQGDFLKLSARGGAYVYGRSDATLNRFGIRIGTSEIYRCIESLAEIVDSLIVCYELPQGEFYMPLFVTLAPGRTLDATTRTSIVERLRADCSPRHIPDDIYAVPDIPYTLTGKKMEIPVRRILQGVPEHDAAARDAMRNPAALAWFVALRASLAARS